MKVKLGRRYRDTITGFEGVATARYEFLHGCVRWQLTGAHPESGGPQDFTFDEPQLEEVKDKTEHSSTSGTGGPHDQVLAPRTGH
jgi:hypothetical protein